MSSTLPKLAAAVAAAALASACLLLPDAGDKPGWRSGPDLAAGGDAAADTVAVPATGTGLFKTVRLRSGGALTLENDYGDVEIAGWERETVEVAVTAAARAPEVEIRETEAGVLVRTRTYEGAGAPPETSFKVRVPAFVDLAGIRISEGDLAVSGVRGRLEASVDKGDLSVTDFSGSVNVSVGTGRADVEVLRPRDADTVTILSRKGDIVLRLERGTGAIVEADASRGVRSDFDLGVRLPFPAVKGWIGQGGPNIILRASGGRVDLVAAAKEPASARPASGN